MRRLFGLSSVRGLLGWVVAVGVLSWSPGPASAAQYSPGASDTEIKIGHTNPYSGPVELFSRIGRTLSAYFRKLNKEDGGINGRKINFVSINDSYKPAETKDAVLQLVRRDKVLLLFQMFGTPPNMVVRNYLNKKAIPHLFLATGATMWGNPKKYPWTMGWDPSYQSEARAFAKHIIKTVKNPRIAVLYQNDDYGKDYLRGFQAGLGSGAWELIVKVARYKPSSMLIKRRIKLLMTSGANVFVNFSTPRAAIDATTYKADFGWKAEHYVSGISSRIRFLMAAGRYGGTNKFKAAGAISAAYMKDPSDSRWKNDRGMSEYRKFMAAYAPNARPNNPLNIYAYTVAQVMAHVLRKAGDNLTRKNIMRQAASIKDLEINTLYPGIKVNTSATDYRPIEQLVLRRFERGRYKVITEPIDARIGAGR